MTRHLLDIDEWSGAVETAEYDEGEDVLIVHREVNVQPIIDNNKELANHGVWNDREQAKLDGPEMRLAASIPVDVAYLWLQKYGVRAWLKEDWPAVKRLLNDIEWQHLRTRNFVI